MVRCNGAICSANMLTVDLQFDANGYTGGCSSVVSIVPSTTEPSNTCTNETFSRLQSLDVEANIVKGPLSRTAWVAQVYFHTYLWNYGAH